MGHTFVYRCWAQSSILCCCWGFLISACAKPALDFVMSVERACGCAGTFTAQTCGGNAAHRFASCLQNARSCENKCVAQPHSLDVLNICLAGNFELLQLFWESCVVWWKGSYFQDFYFCKFQWGSYFDNVENRKALKSSCRMKGNWPAKKNKPSTIQGGSSVVGREA